MPKSIDTNVIEILAQVAESMRQNHGMQQQIMEAQAMKIELLITNLEIYIKSMAKDVDNEE